MTPANPAAWRPTASIRAAALLLAAVLAAALLFAAPARASFGFIATWGGLGTDFGQFNSPSGIVTDSEGNVYVADTDNNRIHEFDSAGSFVRKWGGFGSGDGQFNTPFAVATGPQGEVYVADTFNNRIEEFDSAGSFVRKWGSFGSEIEQFHFAAGVATDPRDDVYVAESFPNSRIQLFGEPPPTIAELTESVAALGLPQGFERSPRGEAPSGAGSARPGADRQRRQRHRGADRRAGSPERQAALRRGCGGPDRGRAGDRAIARLRVAPGIARLPVLAPGPPEGGPGLVLADERGNRERVGQGPPPYARRCPGGIPPGARTSAAPSGPAPPESRQACESS